LGGVSICLIVWSFAFLGSPRQSVYASQILDDARKASDSFIGHSKTLNQKILLRRGNLVIERSVHHGRQPHVQARESTIDAQLQKELYLAHINLNDPLNANDFADWRAAQQEYTDSVKENHQNVTITTRVAGTAITEGSLTLSRSGWRPVARSVEFRGEVPIEISEVSYDISDSPSLIAESAASSSLPTASTATNAPAAADEVSTVDLEISELDLREALHSIGADVSATPEIWRSEHTVFFRAFPENPMQLQTIEEAVDRIPHVKEAREKSERISGAPQTAHGVTPYTTTPPLANALEAKLGSAQAARDFLDSLKNRYTRAMAEAAALDELGKRYSLDTMKTLPPDLQARVNNLAASQLSSLQHDSAEYIQSLSPILDDNAQELRITPPTEESKTLPGCLHWQENAALAVPQLRDLEKNVSLLFVPNQTEMPVVLRADELISDSLKARSFLEQHLTSTCQLFGAN
jgi:hypothetical protein